MKNFSRRQFVKHTLLFGGVLALPMRAVSLGQTVSGGVADIASGDLPPIPLLPLPLGTVRAERWLEHQLWLQSKGITGLMETYPSYSANSAWLGGTGENWERGPYYLRGLVALAWALDDPELQKRARRWIDWSIDNQREDGYFGPRSNDSWWSRMPVMTAIRDYYEATGKQDARVLPFFEKYFRYQAAELPKRPLSNWADARGADNIDSVLWYYQERLADGTATPELAWLLDLARLLHRQTQRWSDDFNHGTARYHVVNTTQALKYPPVVYRLTRDESDRAAFAKGIFNWGLDHGRIDGLPNSDEAARDNQSTRGTESCAVVEALLSTEIALRDMGDASLGDYLELVAYNAMPLMNTPDFSGHCYYALQNSVMATMGYHGFDCDHGDDTAFGAPLGFECCFPNHHMGWGKFIQHMWMATADQGLALVAYGPNRIRATVAGGKEASFRQETDYPFKGLVRLTYHGDDAEFPLDLRIPDWAAGAVIKLNGETLAGTVRPGTFFRLNGVFKSGDLLELNFPDDRIETSRWYNDSVAVRRGPLLYALKIQEDWRVYHGNDTRETKVDATEEQPLREVVPASRWNYGLVVNEARPAESFQVEQREDVPLQPFSVGTAPVVLKARGQVIPEWILENNTPAPQPLGAIAPDQRRMEPIELIPYACGRLKIAHFPRVGNPADFMVREVSSAQKRNVNGRLAVEFDNVIVGPSSDYTLRVHASGAGAVNLVINGVDAGVIALQPAPTEKTGLRDFIEDDARKFKEQQYNHLRFIGADAEKITRIEIVSAEKLPVPEILGITGGATHALLLTNIPRSVATYRVHYGIRPGRLTHIATGFENEMALLTGLKTGVAYHFAIEACVGGRLLRSAEVPFTPGANAGTAPDNTASFSDDFSAPEKSAAHWQKYGAAEQIRLRDKRLVFSRHQNVKALAGENKWRDYACEAVLRLDDASGDAGLIIRATGAASGPNALRAVYFGISAQGHAVVGEIDNAWHPVKREALPIRAGQDYRLRIAAREEQFACYLDGQLVHVFSNARVPFGRVGLRAYQQGFSCASITVRPLDESERNTLHAAAMKKDDTAHPAGAAPEISAQSAFEVVQIKFPKVPGADFHKVEYGLRSGEYTHSLHNIRFNPFQGGRNYTADKVSIGGLESNRSYYMRLVPLRGTVEMPVSREIKIETNFRGKTDKRRLARTIQDAFSAGAGANQQQYTKSLEQGQKVMENPRANQIEIELARKNIIIAQARIRRG